MSNVTKEHILTALKDVIDPELGRDIVSLGMVKNIEVNNGTITAEINLTTPACPLKDRIKNDCINAIKSAVPGAETINIEMGAEVSGAAKAVDTPLAKVKNTIAVASGKGGVGKSTVAANLAVALAKEGAKVGLIDADIYGPSIPMMLGVKEKPKAFQIGNKTMLVPVEKHGLKLMSIGFLIEDGAPVIWRGPMASGALKQFMTDVEWEELDYLFFDMPPGTGDIQLTLSQTIPLTGAVIVTTPQDVSLTDARKALQMFRKVDVPILGVIENMSYFLAPDTGKQYDIFGTGGGSKLSDEMDVPFLGGIPIDPAIRVKSDEGIPVIENGGESGQGKAFIEIARNLAGKVSVVNVDNK